MEEVLHHVLEHSIEDTLYLIPFLFITYLIMEWLEHKTAAKTQETIQKAGKAGPFFGALLGVLPQCGFSAAASTLYAARVISLGTLFAVFLSTSDEMLPVFIARQAPLQLILQILLTKVILGMLFGFIVDAFIRTRSQHLEQLRIHEICERERCACNHGCDTCENNPAEVYSHFDDCGHDCDHSHHHHEHEHDGGIGGIFKSALIHTVQVTIFILLITMVLTFAIEMLGEDTLASFAAGNSLVSIFCAALVGLIPNCAASVVIAELFLDGIISYGAVIAGLMASAGVGVLVLLRANRPIKQSLLILLTLWAFSVLIGLWVSVVM